jgi:hypothetical protein
LPAVPAGQVLTVAAASQGVTSPVAPASTAWPPAPGAVPVAAPLPPSRASNSADLLRLGSGGDLLEPDGQTSDAQATVPDARDGQRDGPPAGDQQVPLPGIDNLAPDAASPREGALVERRMLPAIVPEGQAPPVPSDAVAEAASRVKPFFAIAGLAVGLLGHWHGQTSPREEGERRRPGEGAP